VTPAYKRALVGFFHHHPSLTSEIPYAFPCLTWAGHLGHPVILTDRMSGEDIRAAVAEFDEIWVGVSTPEQRSQAFQALGGDCRVVCGGPAAEGWCGANTPVLGLVEAYAECPPYRAAQYDDRWLELVPRIDFGVGLPAGSGCAWGRCAFCKSPGRHLQRDNWTIALQRLLARGNNCVRVVNTCVAGPSRAMVRRFCDALPVVRAHGARLNAFVGACEAGWIASTGPSDLSALACEIGLEALSDRMLLRLGKDPRMSIDDTLGTTERLLSRGAHVYLLIMALGPAEHPPQVNATMRQINRLLLAYSERLFVSISRPTEWPTAESAAAAGGRVVKIPVIAGDYDRGYWSVGDAGALAMWEEVYAGVTKRQMGSEPVAAYRRQCAAIAAHAAGSARC